MWWVVAAVTTANPSIRVHYIRHGMSVWNAEQAKARASGENDENVKALGKRNMFVDAPLSERGVAEALALRSRLFSDGTDSGELGALVRCATEKTCPAPLLFTSNLRRAIDTGLLALRPLLESDASRRMTILPALQESCHYTDCTPLALNDGVAGAHPWSAQPASDDGNGLLRAPSRALAPSSSVPDGAAPTTTAASALAAAANASTAPELLDAILAMHGAALAAVRHATVRESLACIFFGSHLPVVPITLTLGAALRAIAALPATAGVHIAAAGRSAPCSVPRVRGTLQLVECDGLRLRAPPRVLAGSRC